MTHQCNSYCKNSEHCDMVFTGDTELHIAAPRIARILKSDHGVKVIKVQPSLQATAGEFSGSGDINGNGWWLTWWTGSTLEEAA